MANKKQKSVVTSADRIVQRFNVPFTYSVFFTRNVFASSNTVLKQAMGNCVAKRPHRTVVLIDAGLVAATPDLLLSIERWFKAHRDTVQLLASPEILPGGEQAKNSWHSVQHVMTDLGKLHLCRHSYVIAIGGGSFLDMAGFAAALVHRGVRLIRLPSTVLAQNDAGVGVKNGMNDHGIKNFAGTFAPPFAVINDLDFLNTLPDLYWRGGIAEAFKVAIIKDRKFFKFLYEYAAALAQRDQSAMEILVRHCASLHLKHIRTSGDPFEQGSARPLDFGHWAAHKLESLSNYAIGHGQAVSIGIAIDTVYAFLQRLLTAQQCEHILTALETSGLPIWSDYLLHENDKKIIILDGLDEFREHLGGVLSITLPQGIGKSLEVHQMKRAAIVKAIKWLQKRAG